MNKPDIANTWKCCNWLGRNPKKKLTDRQLEILKDLNSVEDVVEHKIHTQKNCISGHQQQFEILFENVTLKI